MTANTAFKLASSIVVGYFGAWTFNGALYALDTGCMDTAVGCMRMADTLIYEASSFIFAWIILVFLILYAWGVFEISLPKQNGG